MMMPITLSLIPHVLPMLGALLPASVQAPAPPAALATQPVPMILIDDTLRARPIGLLRLDTGAGGGGVGGVGGRPGAVVFVEGGGSPATLGAAKVLALAPPAWAIDDSPDGAARSGGAADPAAARAASLISLAAARNPPAFEPYVELVDGQRFPGAPAPRPGGETGPDGQPAGDGQSLLWSHRRLGVQTIPLESISLIALRPAATPAPPVAAAAGDGDSVVLVNGDRITGYIDAITDNVIVGAPPSRSAGTAAPAPAPTVIPLSQVARVRLSNPPSPPAGPALWLDDGTIVSAARVEADAATRRITVAAAQLDLSDLSAVAIDAARLTPLSALKLSRQEPAPGRRMLEPVVIAPAHGSGPSILGADDVVLPGPMAAEWTLPTGAARIAGWLVLEERSWAWGDCTVTVSVGASDGASGERVLLRGRLNAETPILALHGDLGAAGGKASRTLRISIDPGEHGPVQDRVVIRHSLVQVEPAAH